MKRNLLRVQSGCIKPSDENSGINFCSIDKIHAFEPAVYINADHEISDRIAFLWTSLQYVLPFGQSTVNIYADNNPVTFNSALQIYEKAAQLALNFLRKK
jgi:hypothetical protein